MLKRPITFRDLSGVTRTQNFYFNLEVHEVTEMELDMPGGMSEYWKMIIDTKNSKAMLKAFKDLMSFSYGERGDDDNVFYKKDPVTGQPLGVKFLQTRAYATLFLELLGPLSSDDAFSDFLKGVVPQELVDKMPTNVSLPTPDPVQQHVGTDVMPEPLTARSVEQHTRVELMEMSDEDFATLAGTDPQKMDLPVLQVAMQRKNRAQSAG